MKKLYAYNGKRYFCKKDKDGNQVPAVQEIIFLEEEKELVGSYNKRRPEYDILIEESIDKVNKK